MLRTIDIFLTGILLIALCGCLSRNVEHQVLERGSQSGAALSASHFAVVNTEEEFSELYTRIHSEVLPPPEPPPVDFSESFILVVAMGEKPTSGYAVEIGQVVREGPRLVVEVRSIEPDSERMQATVITRPYALIRIKRQPELKTAVFVNPSGKRLAEAPLN